MQTSVGNSTSLPYNNSGYCLLKPQLFYLEIAMMPPRKKLQQILNYSTSMLFAK